MEKLKELLGEELFKQVVAKLPTDKKFLFAEEGTFIPKHRFDEVNVQNKELKGQVATYDGQLKELQGKAIGNEDLQKQITALKELNEKTIKEYEGRISARELSFAIDSQLAQAKVRNTKAVKALLNLEQVKLTEQGVSGLTEQLDALQKTDAYLFEAPVQSVVPAAKVGQEAKSPAVGVTMDAQTEQLAKLMGIKLKK